MFIVDCSGKALNPIALIRSSSAFFAAIAEVIFSEYLAASSFSLALGKTFFNSLILEFPFGLFHIPVH